LIICLYLPQFQIPFVRTFFFKFFILVILLLLGALAGQSLLLFIAWCYKIELNTSEDILTLLKNDTFQGEMKLYIGLNHIINFLVFPCVFLLIFYKKRLRTYLSLKMFNPWFIPLFIGLLFSLYPIMAYISSLMNKVDWPPFLQGMDNLAMESLGELLKMNTISDLLINITIIGIIPGITEEFLFRGIIQKELKNVLTNDHIIIWITALIFGLMHLQIVGLFPKIIIGAVLGYSYHFSGSLILPMLLHVINNSIATIAHYFNPIEKFESSLPNEEIPFLPVLIITIFAMFIFRYIQSQSKFLQHANE
jgi:uncharacterized protein